MKAFYLTFSILFTVLILIIAFGNIGAQCSNFYFLFIPVGINPTILILLLAIFGMITGAFYHAFMSRVLSTSSEEQDEL